MPYSFGNVDFSFPNQYETIQSTPVNDQLFTFNLTSQRSIDDILMLSHSAPSVANTSNEAVVVYDGSEQRMGADYHVRYTLSQQELGLFGFSTLLADSLVADQGFSGFFTFVAEPDASDNTEVIDKVFTLIIDRSGSMGGDKIVQARDAASFIVNNMNEGDRFNIVDFSTEPDLDRSYQPARFVPLAEPLLGRAGLATLPLGFHLSLKEDFLLFLGSSRSRVFS